MKTKNIKSAKTLVTWGLSAMVILIGTISALAQEKYIGAWRPGKGTSKVLRFNSWEEFTEQWEDLGKKDMRLQDLEVLKTGDAVKYMGTWVPGKGKYALLAYDNFADFAAEWKQMWEEDKSKQLIDVEVVTIGGKTHYIGVWDAGKGGSALYQYNSWEDFVAKWKELAKQDRA
jgi:hypothetical protein